jgi:hypothetical protein
MFLKVNGKNGCFYYLIKMKNIRKINFKQV